MLRGLFDTIKLMKRVSVLGSPGSGKTTFARQLSKQEKLPVVHLDGHFHDSQYNFKNDRSSWVEHVLELTQSEKWIIEGNYRATFEDRFKRSDTVIFLDIPRGISMFRILKRRLVQGKGKRSEMPKDWQEKVDLSFYLTVWRFKKKREEILNVLAELDNTKEVYILKGRKEVKAFLSN